MKKLAVILAGILVLIFVFWFVNTIKFVSWDFRNNLWATTHLIWSGESAYKIKTLFPDSNAIWFPQIVGLFFPLGLLPQYQATSIWLILAGRLLRRKCAALQRHQIRDLLNLVKMQTGKCSLVTDNVLLVSLARNTPPDTASQETIVARKTIPLHGYSCAAPLCIQTRRLLLH